MAEIRCAMCGKNNPAERVTCRYCNAQLSSTPSASGGEDVPDWLSSLRDGSPPEIDQSTGFEAEAEEPDWLSRLGGASPSTPSESSELPDWFAGLGDSLQTEPDKPTDNTPAPRAESESEDLPDWFRSDESDSAIRDWLSGSEDTDQTVQSAASADSLPDWMNSLQSDSSLTGWLSEESEPASTPTLDFSQTGSVFSEPVEDSQNTHESEWLSADQVEQNIDDWFAGPKESPASPPPSEEPDSSSGLPDWLSSLNNASFDLEEEETTPQETEGTPDWLDRVRARRQEDQERITQAEPQDQVSPFVLSDDLDSDLSFDWLNTSSTQESQSSEIARQPEAPVGSQRQIDDDAPEWLRNLNRSFVEPGQETSMAAPDQSDEPIQDFMMRDGAPEPSQNDTGSDPDWLAALSDVPGTPMPAEAVPAFVFDDDEALDFAEEQPVFSQPADDASFTSTPDWLSNVTVEDGGLPLPVEEEPAASELEPAELPTWLEAMRPLDAVTLEAAVDVSEAQVEQGGPLAGLRGALPGEISTKGLRSPAPYSIKLPITEDVENRLNLLKAMLEAEDKPQPQAQARRISNNLVVRLTVFLILAAAVLMALYIGPSQGAVVDPSRISPAAQSFQTAMNISAGSQVLLALDYEPGYAAEINLTLSPVLAYLHNQGVAVTAVSSSVTGALLIERAAGQAEEFQLENGRLRNLGYLPGGTSGLLAFATDPASLIPVDVKENKSWMEAGLNPFAGLDNFSLVIVATDNAKAVNAWAAQLGPLLLQKRIGLLMISSMQSAAVIEPYYATTPRLVGGYLSSLRDAPYSSFVNEQNQADIEALSFQESAFSAVLLVAVMLMAAGGALNLLVDSLSTRKQTRPRSERSEVKA